MSEKSIDDVRAFWDAHPLFSGESDFDAGTLGFFEQHLDVVTRDCFAGRIDPRIFPAPGNMDAVLDLGCGPGLWSIELKRAGARRVVAADLTARALQLTQERARLYGLEIETSQQNAEAMTFADASFSHVNCQGVIHHTPDTAACVREIARVLRPGGTATITVYYRNVILSTWPVTRHVASALSAAGARLRGRGRESIYALPEIDEVVRYYDGAENPIGKAYSRDGFLELLTPHFRVDSTFLHFFPARTLPFRIPAALHRFLNARLGFMIAACCTRPP